MEIIHFLEAFGYGVRNNPHILDSISTNQIKSKIRLIELLNKFEYNNVGVLGCWSLTILGLLLEGKTITGYDIDAKALNIAKKLFPQYTFKNKDVFKMSPNNVKSHDLIINTSCEHMPPMRNWQGWDMVMPNAYFAFQSNNMFHVKDHTNCVETIDDFIMQMPNHITILKTDELQINEYTRFTIVGHA